MKEQGPNWLSRQVLPELQTDFLAYFLKLIAIGLLFGLYLMEQGLSIPRIAVAISLSFLIVGLIACRIDPNLPPDE